MRRQKGEKRLSLRRAGLRRRYSLLPNHSSPPQVTGARAHLIEVAVEATFQPLLQMYLLLPIIIDVFDKDFGSIDLDAFKKMDLLQFLSMVASIVSLAWSFAFYKASLKNEALDFDINPFGRIILIFANLSMVTSRLTAFVVFAYCFPDGTQFLALLSCLFAHAFLMSLLHLCFCLLPTSLKRQLDWQLVVDCILNGLANIYTHQWVSVPHHHQKDNCHSRQVCVSTIDQLVKDLSQARFHLGAPNRV